jgi:hypothetical protein
MISYDEREIAYVFERIPCIKCDSVHARVVMEKVLAFVAAHWEGQRDVKPPSLEDLRKVCCRGPLN